MAQRWRDWLAQAEHDLEQAAASRKDGRHDWACFASHQAAEKAVKALHVAGGKRKMGHIVARLLQELPDCAVLIVDDNLPEEANYERLKRLISTVIGRSPESFKSEATVKIGEGNDDVHERVSAIRGVYLDLDWERRLVSISINPRRVRERRELMRFVGASNDPDPLASVRHDDYLASEDPHGTR